MQGKFLSNLLFLVFLNLLVKPFYILGIDAEVQIQTGSTEYGNYFALLNFTFLFNILLDFGISNYNNRSVSRNANKLNSEYPYILGTRWLLLPIYIVVSSSAALLLGFSQDQWELLVWLFFNQFLISSLLYVRSNLAALQLFKQDSIVSVTDRVLLILFCSLLLWGGIRQESFKIEWFVYAQTLAYSIALLLAFAMMPRGLKWVLPKFNLDRTKSILKKSWPFALLTLLMMIYNRTDSIMLERLLDNGKTEAGHYALGFRLYDAVNMFAMLFAVILLPMFSKMIKKKEGVADLVKTSFKLLMSVAIPIATMCALFPKAVLELRYPHVAPEASEAFSWLMLSFLGVCCTYTFGALLTANGNLKALNQMAVSGIIVNIALNFLLIPQWGAQGAALATFFTQILTGAIQIGLAQYFFRFSVIQTLLLPTLHYGVICFSAFFLNREYGSDNWLVLAGVFTACIVLSSIIGMLHILPLLEGIRTKR